MFNVLQPGYHATALVLLACTRVIAQSSLPGGMHDFFPLEIGREWTYSYKSLERTYESLIQLMETRDSGLVRFTVVSWSDEDSVISWQISEKDSLFRQQDDVFRDDRDTTYWLVENTDVYLVERKDGNHKLIFSSHFPVFWRISQVHTWPPIPDSVIVSSWIDRYDTLDTDKSVSFGTNLWLINYWHTRLMRVGVGAVTTSFSAMKGPNTPYYFNSTAELLSTVVSVDNPKQYSGPDESAISCFPNPFNAHTTVMVTLSDAGWVSLRLFDILGRKVRELANEYLSSGIHRFEFSSNGLPSGVYLCELRRQGDSRITRLILTR